MQPLFPPTPIISLISLPRLCLPTMCPDLCSAFLSQPSRYRILFYTLQNPVTLTPIFRLSSPPAPRRLPLHSRPSAPISPCSARSTMTTRLHSTLTPGPPRHTRQRCNSMRAPPNWTPPSPGSPGSEISASGATLCATWSKQHDTYSSAVRSSTIYDTAHKPT